METLHFSVSKNRFYKRKFDHDAARALREAGFAYKTVGKMLGVSTNAVMRVCDPEIAKKMAARSKRYYEDNCEMCGTICVSPNHPSKRSRPNHDGRALCKRCRSDTVRVRLRFDELGNLAAVKCVNCQVWQQPEMFTRGTRHREVREGGIHQFCRGCQTKGRQDYRERHKVPCNSCGRPRLPQSEKRKPGSRDSGLCKSCWLDSVRVA